mmetsp:Transcript_83803/g.233743  ORF Transcript_83803/g.233743 Transcript_83803/m.233743 type:complete len:255 (+) Transcript_83803:301-1065(+)
MVAHWSQDRDVHVGGQCGRDCPHAVPKCHGLVSDASKHIPRHEATCSTDRCGRVAHEGLCQQLWRRSERVGATSANPGLSRDIHKHGGELPSVIKELPGVHHEELDSGIAAVAEALPETEPRSGRFRNASVSFHDCHWPQIGERTFASRGRQRHRQCPAASAEHSDAPGKVDVRHHGQEQRAESTVDGETQRHAVEDSTPGVVSHFCLHDAHRLLEVERSCHPTAFSVVALQVAARNVRGRTAAKRWCRTLVVG